MQLDRDAINKLLSLNDFQLKIVITRLMRENNIDPKALNIDTKNIASIRKTLENASDKDIDRFIEMLGKLHGGN